jgi:hypothetical protein
VFLVCGGMHFASHSSFGVSFWPDWNLIHSQTLDRLVVPKNHAIFLSALSFPRYSSWSSF